MIRRPRLYQTDLPRGDLWIAWEQLDRRNRGRLPEWGPVLMPWHNRSWWHWPLAIWALWRQG